MKINLKNLARTRVGMVIIGSLAYSVILITNMPPITSPDPFQSNFMNMTEGQSSGCQKYDSRGKRVFNEPFFET